MGVKVSSMPPAVAYLRNRLAVVGAGATLPRFAVLALLHGIALVVMLRVEQDAAGLVAFLLTWGVFNFLWLMLLRRAATAAALSLAMVFALIGLSWFKHDILFMTVNFLDLMIIDLDTFSFLLTVFPWLGKTMLAGVATAAALVTLIWWYDPHHVRVRVASVGCAACVAGLTGITYAVPADPYDEFYPIAYVSKFGRSAVTSVVEYFTRGYLESDAEAAERLGPAAGDVCPAAKRPHIIMVHDESSFDFTAAPGIKVPPDYRRHFASFDGKQRSLVVEGAGGPSWFTEYNILTGLSARSYGRFADFLTRIAAGRVERGMPHVLRRCGYRTFSLYSYFGAFLNARNFQKTTGIEHFIDKRDMGAEGIEPDDFYFGKAFDVFARERGNAPLFMLVYTVANHFPWDYRFRPDLTPGWVDPGNGFEPDEYIRRQVLSAQHYRDFIERLKREFPDDQFLIVRFGDHQPSVARNYIDPAFDDSARARRIANHDVRFLTTYYAIEAMNFRPVDLSSALETLDAPYLPLVVLEAAGVPLDPSFAEQKRILQRCRGLFYRCSGGAEARRFNRLLIDAGLIKGL